MVDKRTVNTIKKIRSAFTELITTEKGTYFTIKEIAGKAKINRKTFYLHFNCIEDLYRDLEEETEKKLLDILENRNFFAYTFSIEILLDGLLELISTNEPLYSKLLVDDDFKFVFRNVKDKIKLKLIDSFSLEKNLKTNLYVEFLFTGLIKVFRVWQKNKNEMSKEELYKYVVNLINNGYEGLKIDK